MNKLRTNKSVSKRYKITATYRFLRHHAFKGHLLAKKSNKNKRKLSSVTLVSVQDTGSLKLMLPYRFIKRNRK